MKIFASKAKEKVEITFKEGEIYIENGKKVKKQQEIKEYSIGLELSPSDSLFARTRTTGIVNYSIEFQKDPWKIVDCGGQISERKKWVNCNFHNI